MKKLLLTLAVLAACSGRESTSTSTIAPAEPRPSDRTPLQIPERPVISTAGSPPPVQRTAPGTHLVTLTSAGFEMRNFLPLGHAAFRVRNGTGIAHELLLRGRDAAVAAALPPGGEAVLQLVLTERSYELVCTVPGHAERMRLTTYAPGAPLRLPESSGDGRR